MSVSSRKPVSEPKIPLWFFWQHRAAVLLGLGAVALMVLLLYLDNQYKSNQNGPFRNEYQGKIVDKWAKYTESETGSRPNFALMIKQDDGKRFPVTVSSEIYQKAKVGMRIKKTPAGSVELMNEETGDSKGS